MYFCLFDIRCTREYVDLRCSDECGTVCWHPDYVDFIPIVLSGTLLERICHHCCGDQITQSSGSVFVSPTTPARLLTNVCTRSLEVFPNTHVYSSFNHERNCVPYLSWVRGNTLQRNDDNARRRPPRANSLYQRDHGERRHIRQWPDQSKKRSHVAAEG